MSPLKIELNPSISFSDWEIVRRTCGKEVYFKGKGEIGDRIPCPANGEVKLVVKNSREPVCESVDCENIDE